MIAGRPTLEIRRLLRRTRNGALDAPTVHEDLGIPLGEAESVIEGLAKEGLIVKGLTTGPDGQQRSFWKNTIKGNSLAMATTAQPVKRATADRALAQLLDRVSVVNAREDFAFRVERVVVFGSYLSSAQEINDVDLLVDLVARYADSNRQDWVEQSSRTRASQSGRRFRDSLEQMAWPRMEVEGFLKNRSRTLSLHYADHKLMKRTEHRVVFEARLGTRAGQ